MQRETISTTFPLGSKMPSFSLRSVDDALVTDRFFDGAKASLVVFTCNHCPYVKGSEQMMLSVLRPLLGAGLKVAAINSNDPVQYPEDDFDRMKEKARSLDLPYPYLFDETQEVARAFDAACTPECYLFDASRSLVFHGTVNDNPRSADGVQREYLSGAVKAVLEGSKPNPEFVHPIGCSIKWKQAI